MAYHSSKTVSMSFDDAIIYTAQTLRNHVFGDLITIDMQVALDMEDIGIEITKDGTAYC